MAEGSISSHILIRKRDLWCCLQCSIYFEWENYHHDYELMDYLFSMFRLQSYSHDDYGPDDAIPCF